VNTRAWIDAGMATAAQIAKQQSDYTNSLRAGSIAGCK
jgi:hypothetical protein